jgi:hypothetical protein
MKNRVAALFAGCCLLLSAATANAAFLDGAYGTKDGCAYAKTGDSSGADDFALLTAKKITGSTFACTITKAVPGANKGFKVTATCEAEGEEGGEAQAITVIPSGKDAYSVSFDDGTHLGPLPKCK